MVFEHVEFIVLAVTEGDLGNLALDVIKMFEEKRKSKKQSLPKTF